MALTPDPRLVAAIRRQPAYLRLPLLTTALIESGGRLDAIGDNGDSAGGYQENIHGRGAGLSLAQRMDPFASTARAAREFTTFYQRGARGADLAFRAQRPADRTSYVSRYNSLLSEAQRILGGAPAPAPAPVSNQGPARAGPGRVQGGGVSPGSLPALGRYLRQSESAVLAGQMPGDVMPVLAKFGTAPRAPLPPAPVRGVQRQQQPAQVTGKAVTGILPGAAQWGSYGYGDPEGQGGRHLAVDWFAKAGTPVRAGVSGKVVRLTPDPTPGQRASGQVFGGTLAIRMDDGRLVVMRHIVPGALRVGQRVDPTSVVGSPKDWTGGSHIHLETYRAGSSDREYGSKYAFNPRELFA